VSGPKSERTRSRILDAAAQVFSDRGYSEARLVDIATAAGIQTGSLYYHFDSREALVEEVLRLGVVRAEERVRADVTALGVDATPLARLRTAMAAHLSVILERGAYASANARIFGQVPEEVRKRHYAEQQAYGAYWNELITDAQRAGELRPGLDPYVVRMLLFGAMNWAAEWYRPSRGRPPAVIVEHLLTIALDGLRTGTAGEATGGGATAGGATAATTPVGAGAAAAAEARLVDGPGRGPVPQR
jgi:TetR/AcrR family transcriptional regulator, cholesterol catabolism regulator